MVLGIAMAGASLLGGLQAQHYARKETAAQRDYWKGVTKQREQFAQQNMMPLFQDLMRQTKQLPGQLKQFRQGKMASEAQNRMQRFQRNLARSGATRASTAGMQGAGQIRDDLNLLGQQMLTNEKQAVLGAQGRALSMGQQMGNFMMPSAGHAASQMPFQESYYNPLDAVSQGLFGGMIGREMARDGGGGGGSQGGGFPAQYGDMVKNFQYPRQDYVTR